MPVTCTEARKGLFRVGVRPGKVGFLKGNESSVRLLFIKEKQTCSTPTTPVSGNGMLSIHATTSKTIGG